MSNELDYREYLRYQDMGEWHPVEVGGMRGVLLRALLAEEYVKSVVLLGVNRDEEFRLRPFCHACDRPIP